MPETKKEKSTNPRPTIPPEVKTKLWLKSGGRCQYKGCNKALWEDSLTYKEMNTSYIAHIYGWAEGSARHDPILSPKLGKNFSNLMLMCDIHHREIDNKKTRALYPAADLIEIKRKNEQRIEFLTSLKPDRRSHVVLFGGKIGMHESPLQKESAYEAILPDFYPTDSNPIEIGIKNLAVDDSDSSYWEIHRKNLEKQFSQKITSLKGSHEVQHFSIFGLATQPLLINLGILFSDLYQAEVYQLHREPSTWKWVESDDIVNHKFQKVKKGNACVALKLELSGIISDDRITSVLGDECSIWSLTHSMPNNDYIRSREDLVDFRKKLRSAFDKIKRLHGQNTILHVFPAMPISVSIEFGRVWMAKADMSMVIYDQNKDHSGFHSTISF